METIVDLQQNPSNETRRKGSILPEVKTTIQHILVVFCLTTFICSISAMNLYRPIDSNVRYGPELEFLIFVIGLFPYLSIPVTLFNCLGLLMYNPYRKNVAKRPDLFSGIPYICFRVVTRGDMPDFVIRNAKFNRNLCLNFGLENFTFEIASDKHLHGQDKDRIREVIVPKGYATKKGSLYKARALNYCLEPDVNELAGNDWIVHLDEETLLTEEAIAGILHFIQEGDADIGQGPISYANGEVIRNWLTTLSDSVRLSLDHALFRFQFSFLNKPVFGFKGSYIVIRNNIEMEIGLDNGPDGSIAEDCYFALKAWARGYKFGFVTGEMREKSPFTLVDFVRQRRRWFVGQAYTVLSEEIPMVYKLGILSSITCCLLMPVSLSNIYIDIFYPMQRPVICCILNGLVGGTFSFLYFFGAFMSCSERKWSYLRHILVSFFCCIVVAPFAGVMESLAAYWGVLTFNSNEFFIVQKEIPKRIRQKGTTKFL